MQKLKIDIVSDVVCPWCFIGTRRLAQALEAAGVQAEIEHHPFLLQPDTPAAGLDLRAMLKSKYRADPDTMFVGVEREAKKTGIPLDFKKITRMPNTIRAHTLIRAAKDKGTQLAIADAFFNAYFLEGKDVSDTAVLTHIASAHGFSESEVTALLADDDALAQTRAEASGAAQDGISGVPFFIFQERLAVEGAQSLEIFGEAIRQALATPLASAQ